MIKAPSDALLDVQSKQGQLLAGNGPRSPWSRCNLGFQKPLAGGCLHRAMGAGRGSWGRGKDKQSREGSRSARPGPQRQRATQVLPSSEGGALSSRGVPPSGSPETGGWAAKPKVMTQEEPDGASEERAQGR